MSAELIRDLLDDEGENRAVRAFLLYYGGGNSACPIISMRAHLARSGFDGCWPQWAAAPNSSALTKAGAQLWLRHLFALEGSRATPPSPSTASEAGEPSAYMGQDGKVYPASVGRICVTDEPLYRRAALASRPAVEVGELPPLEVAFARIRALEKAGMEFGARLCHLDTKLIKGVDYLSRDSVMNEVVAWRTAFDNAPKFDARAALVAKPAAPLSAMDRLRKNAPEFAAHLDRCAAEVATWPAWKRDMWGKPAASDPDGDFAKGMLIQLHRMGASPAGLSLAVQLFGVGPCPGCGFRKLHCRCPQPAKAASEASPTSEAESATRFRAEGGNTQPSIAASSQFANSESGTMPSGYAVEGREVDVEAERKLFEAWASANGFKTELRSDAESPDTYFRYETEQRWLVWIAARRQAGDAGKDAQRLNTFIDWYLRGGSRSEIHLYGHIVQTTREIVLAGLDAIAAATQPKEPQ